MTLEERTVAEAAIHAEPNANPIQLEADIAAAAQMSRMAVKGILAHLLDDGYLKVQGGPAIGIAESGYPGNSADMWYEKDRNWSD